MCSIKVVSFFFFFLLGSKNIKMKNRSKSSTELLNSYLYKTKNVFLSSTLVAAAAAVVVLLLLLLLLGSKNIKLKNKSKTLQSS
jgi:ABC-type sugar transport system permease subunit